MFGRNKEEVKLYKENAERLEMQLKSLRAQLKEVRDSHKDALRESYLKSQDELRDARNEAREHEYELNVRIKELTRELEIAQADYDGDRDETINELRNQWHEEIRLLKDNQAEFISGMVSEQAQEIAELTREHTKELEKASRDTVTALEKASKAEGVVSALTASNKSLENQLDSYRKFVEMTLGHLPNVDMSKFQFTANIPASKSEVKIIK